MRRIVIGLYGFGLIQIIMLSAYHFYLPTQTQWQLQVQGAPLMMSWSLFLLNYGWSLMAFIFASLLFSCLMTPSRETQTKQYVAGSFLLYWLVHTMRIFFVPAPVPESMGWINQIIQGFSVQIVILMALGVIVFRPQNAR
ncbi:MAG: hypothetical protein DHS20C06_07510 [Hyphobacterium sp.]|nr:MAG: hypothetical protein DHS20C06_07510 [Hyphobacterium sp.]